MGIKENIISCLENAQYNVFPFDGTKYFFTTQKRMDSCGGEDGLRKMFWLPPDPYCKVVVVPPTVPIDVSFVPSEPCGYYVEKGEKNENG